MKKYAELFQALFTISLYALGALLLAGALWPALAWILFLVGVSSAGIYGANERFFLLVLALGIGSGYFIFGFALAAETVALRYLLGLKLEEGEFSFFSAQGVKWAVANALMLILNLTFMDFMRLTPFLPWYYRLMGAKIGKRVQINSKGIADVSMLEIGDDMVVGGDAVLIGHLAEHGRLKLRRTVIGRKVTLGLGAVIMPGARIGDEALIAARSVLPKFTEVPARSIFGGMPAKLIRMKDDPA